MSLGHQVLEIDLGAVEVVAGRQAGLEHHHRRGATRPARTPSSSTRTGRVERSASTRDVRVAGMDEDLLVLLEPRVERGPFERAPCRPARSTLLAVDPRRARPRSPSPTRSPCTPRRPALGALRVRARRRARPRRRRRAARSTADSSATPTRSSARVVSSTTLAAEVAADPARHRLDVIDRHRRARIVAGGGDAVEPVRPGTCGHDPRVSAASGAVTFSAYASRTAAGRGPAVRGWAVPGPELINRYSRRPPRSTPTAGTASARPWGPGWCSPSPARSPPVTSGPRWRTHSAPRRHRTRSAGRPSRPPAPGGGRCPRRLDPHRLPGAARLAGRRTHRGGVRGDARPGRRRRLDPTHTLGLIERFPVDLTGALITLVSTLAAKVTWPVPFGVVEAAGGPARG